MSEVAAKILGDAEQRPSPFTTISHEVLQLQPSKDPPKVLPHPSVRKKMPALDIPTQTHGRHLAAGPEVAPKGASLPGSAAINGPPSSRGHVSSTVQAPMPSKSSTTATSTHAPKATIPRAPSPEHGPRTLTIMKKQRDAAAAAVRKAELERNRAAVQVQKGTESVVRDVHAAELSLAAARDRFRRASEALRDATAAKAEKLHHGSNVSRSIQGASGVGAIGADASDVEPAKHAQGDEKGQNLTHRNQSRVSGLQSLGEHDLQRLEDAAEEADRQLAEVRKKRAAVEKVVARETATAKKLAMHEIEIQDTREAAVKEIQRVRHQFRDVTRAAGLEANSAASNAQRNSTHFPLSAGPNVDQITNAPLQSGSARQKQSSSAAQSHTAANRPAVTPTAKPAALAKPLAAAKPGAVAKSAVAASVGSPAAVTPAKADAPARVVAVATPASVSAHAAVGTDAQPRFKMGYCRPSGLYTRSACCPTGYTQVSDVNTCHKAFLALLPEGASWGGQVLRSRRPSGCYRNLKVQKVRFNPRGVSGNGLKVMGDDEVLCERKADGIALPAANPAFLRRTSTAYAFDPASLTSQNSSKVSLVLQRLKSKAAGFVRAARVRNSKVLKELTQLR